MKEKIRLVLAGVSFILLTLLLLFSLSAKAAPSPKLEGLHAFGSGVFINNNCDLVTAAHVVNGADAVKVLINNEWVKADVLLEDSKEDVAILHAHLTNCPFVRLEPQVKLIDTVYAVGFPRPQEMTYNQIITKGIISLLNFDNMLLTNLTIAPGNSGGALFNEGGDLIGITVAGFTGMMEFGTDYSLSVPSSTIIKLITINKLPVTFTIVPLTDKEARYVINLSTVVMIGNFKKPVIANNTGTIEVSSKMLKNFLRQHVFHDTSTYHEDVILKL
jgi:hypothetical protein